MTPTELHDWRERCGLTSWEAAATVLGLSRRQIYRLQRGEQEIGTTLELACEAIERRREDERRGLKPWRPSRSAT